VSRRTSDRPLRTLRVLAVTSALAWGPGAALAVDTTVITDGTLGDVVEFTDLDVTISADLGQESGRNLFHSFDRFDVGTGGSATFDLGENNNGPYTNVISRVTGTGGPSQIDGKIISNLNEENFFFLNPAGTIFGAGASLHLPGSFYVSTADVLAFETGDHPFSTGDGTTKYPTLNSAAPDAFGFLAAVPASIEFEGARLEVDEGMTLSAVGGNVTVYGGSLKAPGGQVQLVSVAAPTPTDYPVPLDASQIEVGDYAEGELGIVTLTEQLYGRAELNVSSLADGQRGTGRIVIRAGKFVMEGSELNAISKFGNANAGDETAIDIAVTGNIEIYAFRKTPDSTPQPADLRSSAEGGTTGDIRLAGKQVTLAGSGSRLLTENFGSEAGADIDVDANMVTVGDGASIVTSSFDKGDAGGISISGPEVEINAASADSGAPPNDRAEIHLMGEGTHVTTEAGTTLPFLPEGFGRGGVIDIDATTLEVTNDAKIVSINIHDSAGGGVIDIDATTLKVTDRGLITSQTLGEGRGGDVFITAHSVELDTGGQIRAVTEADARGGDLSVIARESPLITGAADNGQPSGIFITGAADDGQPSGIFATSGRKASTDATGNAGNLSVSAPIVELHAGGEIGASTFGKGNAGNLEIKDAQLVLIQGGPGSEVSTVHAQGVSGSGGNLTIIADEIKIIDGGEVTATTTGTGNSGDVVLVARTVLVQGETQEDIPQPSGVFAKTTLGTSVGGNSGSIDITATESVRVVDGGVIAVSSERGGGFAGDIVFRGGGSVEVSEGGQIKAEVLEGITNPLLGNASDIRILDADQVILASGGKITAETRANGFGGTIAITASDVHLSGNAQITASSTGLDADSGPAGNIQIAATHNLEITDGSSIKTSAANAAGGNVELQAGNLLYILDSTVETDVKGAGVEEGENAGDINIPFAEIEIPEEAPFQVASLVQDVPGAPVTPVIPRFVVINRSLIEANANSSDAGNVRIEGGNVIVSSDSVIEATSQTGVDGVVEISAPDADIASQIAPLQAAFVDASDRLLPPCVARTERTGSFAVQRRERIPASPDAPLPASLVGSAAGTVDPGACSTSQGSP